MLTDQFAFNIKDNDKLQRQGILTNIIKNNLKFQNQPLNQPPLNQNTRATKFKQLYIQIIHSIQFKKKENYLKFETLS